MGRVVVKIRVENLMDVLLAEQNRLPKEQVRSIELEALVDTGATLLCLPKTYIEELGLALLGERTALTGKGPIKRKVFRGAQLTIKERTCTVDVLELPEDVPALVGYIPLENLDLWVDPVKQELVPNPAHNGEFALELY